MEQKLPSYRLTDKHASVKKNRTKKQLKHFTFSHTLPRTNLATALYI